jgi:Amt family ammonium transporter
MAADPGAIGRIAVTTNTAGALAALSATLTAWIMLGKPDLGMTLNGCLAGLVAITAPCAFVTVESSVIIGAIAGVLVVLAVIMFDRLHIDDPVGATSVHLVNGVFGTLCVGLFGQKEIMQSGAMVTTGLPNNGLFFGGGMDQLMPQIGGVLLVGGYVFVVSFVAWQILKATVGIRVSQEEEMMGLDIGEHGNEAYHGFVMSPVNH